MSKREIIDMALRLKADERYEIAEKILQSLDKPDEEIDSVWADQALQRTRACDQGAMKTISFGDVFGET